VFAILLSLLEIKDSEYLRFAYSSEQGFDESCGLSTLSCLLSTYWGLPASEDSLAVEAFSSKAESDYAISFADMKGLLKARGFSCASYRMNYEQLSAAIAAYAPVIVHYDKPAGHFSLVLRSSGPLLVVADPAEGLVAMERGDFEKRWSGHILLSRLPGSKPDGAKLDAACASALARRELLDRAAMIAAGGHRW
ncbi:MAG: cysteine peptidase family C39 domain-containing protein, partial [Spirochaetaceae bacterium]|nr:cysteine peptidase family C39 domain-containing protein [Spirochaetaceae bacterium]